MLDLNLFSLHFAFILVFVYFFKIFKFKTFNIIMLVLLVTSIILYIIVSVYYSFIVLCIFTIYLFYIIRKVAKIDTNIMVIFLITWITLNIVSMILQNNQMLLIVMTFTLGSFILLIIAFVFIQK